jgi:hypothetical protein
MGSSFPCGNGAYLVLLRVGFTKLPQSLGVLVSSYLTFSPLPCGIGEAAIPWGGIFSVALSLPPNSALQTSGTVRITDHPALWSSDFPPLLISASRDLRRSDHLFPFDSPPFLSSLLKNAHLRRFPYPSSLRRTLKYALDRLTNSSAWQEVTPYSS